MSHVEPRPTRPGAWAAALCTVLFLAPPAFALDVFPLRVQPASPCVTDDVRLVFRVCTCNSRILSAARVSEVDARLDVATDPTVVCVQCAPDTIGVDFGRLAAGHHGLGGMIVHHITAGPDSGQVKTENYAVEFDVRNDCSPPPEPLPFLNEVLIGAACPTCPQQPCPGDSILVRLKGTFTDPCYAVVELSAQPNPSASPLPQPDVVRIVYEHDSCSSCPAVLTPWSGALPIGPLPLGDYRLPVEAWMRERCPGSTNDSLVFLGRTAFPFNVGICPPTGPCYLAAFDTPAGTLCTSVVGPDRPGDATFVIGSGAPVGGVQGKLTFDRPGLRVIGIEPALQGTILKWDPTASGASFVAVLPTIARPDVQPLRLFNVRVALVPGASLTGVVRLMPDSLLVSDTNGIEVPMCDISRVRQTDPAARFCPEAGCDMNADGRADVRDLVLMVNCLQHPEDRCAGATTPDCDGNGQRNLDDVLCCAHTILGGSRPDSTGSVPAPQVAVEFGVPVAAGDGVDVPMRVTARSLIGAARLEFAYPDNGFTNPTIALAQQAPNWLVLNEGGAGTLRVGLIRTAPEAQAGDAPLAFTIHLAKRLNSSPEGALSFVSGDFSNPDGAALVTSAAPVSMPLGGGAMLAVGRAHPNPFGRETRFSVALRQNAEIDVSVFDLAGRRVATIYHGFAVGGTRDMVWNRTRDDGTVAPSGVYFYRVTVGGQSQGGKVLVLSRD